MSLERNAGEEQEKSAEELAKAYFAAIGADTLISEQIQTLDAQDAIKFDIQPSEFKPKTQDLVAFSKGFDFHFMGDFPVKKRRFELQISLPTTLEGDIDTNLGANLTAALYYSYFTDEYYSYRTKEKIHMEGLHYSNTIPDGQSAPTMPLPKLEQIDANIIEQTKGLIECAKKKAISLTNKEIETHTYQPPTEINLKSPDGQYFELLETDKLLEEFRLMHLNEKKVEFTEIVTHPGIDGDSFRISRGLNFNFEDSRRWIEANYDWNIKGGWIGKNTSSRVEIELAFPIKNGVVDYDSIRISPARYVNYDLPNFESNTTLPINILPKGVYPKAIYINRKDITPETKNQVAELFNIAIYVPIPLTHDKSSNKSLKPLFFDSLRPENQIRKEAPRATAHTQSHLYVSSYSSQTKEGEDDSYRQQEEADAEDAMSHVVHISEAEGEIINLEGGAYDENGDEVYF